MAVPELPTAVSRFHKESARWMGPAAGVQHPYWRVILQAGTVNMATDYPIEAVAQRPGGCIPVECRNHLLPATALLHRQGGAGQPQAAAPALQLNQGLITPIIQPLPAAGAMAEAIPMDDRQPLTVFGPVNVAVANPKLWHVLLDGAHGR